MSAAKVFHLLNMAEAQITQRNTQENKGGFISHGHLFNTDHLHSGCLKHLVGRCRCSPGAGHCRCLHADMGCSHTHPHLTTATSHRESRAVACLKKNLHGFQVGGEIKSGVCVFWSCRELCCKVINVPVSAFQGPVTQTGWGMVKLHIQGGRLDLLSAHCTPSHPAGHTHLK